MTVAMESAIKVVSFNLKRDSRFARSHRWEYRRELVTRLIEESGAAVVGVQEMLPSMKADIQRRLADYSVFGLGRTKKMDNEHAAILLRNTDLDLVYNETFWLSKHPERSGSRAYFAMFPRICTVCEAYSRKLSRKIRIFNTHFDHVCGPARTLGVKIILEYMHRMNQKEKLPTILMGDLNAHPDSKPIRILTENLHDYPDIHLSSIYSGKCGQGIRNTYHGFKGRIGGEPIDYIFVTDEFAVEEVYLDTTNSDGRYPSDHFPLVAVLGLKEPAEDRLG